MITTDHNIPVPNLQIIPIDRIHPHEQHDSQRAAPLLRILRQAVYLTNPPIVAPIGQGDYVVLDGANRLHCFQQLDYPHLLVQVVDYDSPFVELSVWNHVISGWQADEFVARLQTIEHIRIANGWNQHAIAQILLNDGRALIIQSEYETIAERNQCLRDVVATYQRTATLNRTALHDPLTIWSLYPDAIALVVFPQYTPHDIVAASTQKAYLPPGVSRHIVQGRALKLNYPLAKLRDMETGVAAKNQHLQDWVQHKIATRAIRYYAESTYQFDE